MPGRACPHPPPSHKTRPVVPFDLDPQPLTLRLHDLEVSIQEFLKSAGMDSNGLGTREIQELRENVVQTGGFLHNDGREALLTVIFQPPAQKLRRRADDAQGVPDFVGNPRDHLSQRGQALGLVEFLLELQSILGLAVMILSAGRQEKEWSQTGFPQRQGNCRR